MNYGVIVLLTLFLPFTELCLVWFVAWVIHASYGKVSWVVMVLMCAVQCVAILSSFAAMYIYGWWDLGVCLVSAIVFCGLASAMTCVQWSRNKTVSGINEKRFMQIEVNLIQTNIVLMAKAYINTLVSTAQHMMTGLTAGGYGSAVLGVFLAVLAVVSLISVMFYVVSVGIMDITSLSNSLNDPNTLLGQLRSKIDIEIPIIDDNFDVGLVLLDRIWTWGGGLATEVMYSTYQVARFAWSIFIPFINITIIFWRELFWNTVGTVYECGTQAMKGQAAHGDAARAEIFDGTVGDYIGRTGGFMVEQLIASFDALTLSPPEVRGVNSTVGVPGWLHPDWTPNTRPIYDLVQQGLIISRDFSLCACNSTTSSELTKLVYFATYEPAASTVSNMIYYFATYIMTFIRMPFRLFAYGTLGVESIFELVVAAVYFVANTLALVDQLLGKAFTGLFAVVNKVLEAVELAPLITFNEPLPARGVFAGVFALVTPPLAVIEYVVGIILCIWELIQMIIATVYHAFGAVIYCGPTVTGIANCNMTFDPTRGLGEGGLPPTAFYRTEAYTARVHADLERHLTMTNAAEYGMDAFENVAYFLYYCAEKTRYVFTLRGTLSPEPYDAVTIASCTANVNYPMSFVYHSACGGLQLMWGLMNIPRSVLRLFVGFVTITINLDGSIHTFDDWSAEMGSFAERSVARAAPSVVNVTITYGESILSHDGSSAFLANPYWDYNERGWQFAPRAMAEFHLGESGGIVTIGAVQNTAWLMDDVSVYACDYDQGQQDEVDANDRAVVFNDTAHCPSTKRRLVVCPTTSGMGTAAVKSANDIDGGCAFVAYSGGNLRFTGPAGPSALIPHGAEVRIWDFSVREWIIEEYPSGGQHLVSLHSGACYLTAVAGEPVCRGRADAGAAYFERSGWSRDDIHIKMAQDATSWGAGLFDMSPNVAELAVVSDTLGDTLGDTLKFESSSVARGSSVACKMRTRTIESLSDADNDDTQTSSHLTHVPCDYFSIGVTESVDTISERCSNDQSLLPLWYASESMKRSLDEFVNQDTKWMLESSRSFLRLLNALPKFILSVPQVVIDVSRSTSRAIVFAISGLVGKQPWFRRVDGTLQSIPTTVPMDCDWGVRTIMDEPLVAKAGSCFMADAPIQKYPTAEVLAYGHTPWYFEHMRSLRSRALVYQDAYSTLERALGAYSNAWLGLSGGSDPGNAFVIATIIDKPFVHMQFVDEFAGFNSNSLGDLGQNDDETTSSMCPVHYCPPHVNYYECSLYLSSKTFGDVILWTIRSLDSTNKRSTFDAVPFICSTTRWYMALGGHSAIIIREIGLIPDLITGQPLLNFDLAKLTRGFAALGRTLNTPIIYAQLVINWLGALLDPANAQAGTSITFDGFKQGALMSVYEVLFEQNELAWDIFEGATHAGILANLNAPIKELGGTIQSIQQSVAMSVADLASYTIRVTGGAIIASVPGSESAAFLNDTCWYGYKLIETLDGNSGYGSSVTAGGDCTLAGWDADPLVAWMEYQVDRISMAIFANAERSRLILKEFNRVVIAESPILGPLGKVIDETILSCDNVLMHSVADVVINIEDIAQDVDLFIENALNDLIASPINGVVNAVEDVQETVMDILQQIVGVFTDGLRDLHETIDDIVFGGIDNLLRPFVSESLHIFVGMPPGIPDIEFEWNPFAHISNILNGIRSAWTHPLNPLLAIGTAVDATTEVVDTVINTLFDGATFKEGIVTAWAEVLSVIVVTPKENPLGINMYSIERADIKVGVRDSDNMPTVEQIFQGQRAYEKGDVYFKDVSFFSALLDRAALPNFKGVPYDLAENAGDYEFGFGIYPQDLSLFMTSPVMAAIQLQPLTVTYADPELKEKRSLFGQMKKGAEAYKSFAHFTCSGDLNGPPDRQEPDDPPSPPSDDPGAKYTNAPTMPPTPPTGAPTADPTPEPTTTAPTLAPTGNPTRAPTLSLLDHWGTFIDTIGPGGDGVTIHRVGSLGLAFYRILNFDDNLITLLNADYAGADSSDPKYLLFLRWAQLSKKGADEYDDIVVDISNQIKDDGSQLFDLTAWWEHQGAHRRRRLLTVEDKPTYWEWVETIAHLYDDLGLLDPDLACDRILLFTLRRAIPTPWSHDVVTCINNKINSDLYAHDTNSTAPAAVHYDSGAWWAHARSALLHTDVPKHLAAIARAHLHPANIADRARFIYPRLSRKFRAAHMKAKHHLLRNETVLVDRHQLHPSVRHIAYNHTVPTDEPRSALLQYLHARWTHRDDAEQWINTVYPIRRPAASVSPPSGARRRRRLLSVAQDAKSLTTCIKCKQIDDLWAAIVDTIDITIKSYAGTTLRNGVVVEPIGVRLTNVADDIAADAAEFADITGGQPIGFPLFKRAALSRGDKNGWRYLAKTDNVIFSSVRRARDTFRGLEEQPTIDIDALFGACSSNEENSGGILFKRISREGVAQGGLWGAVAFIVALTIGGPINVLIQWVVIPVVAYAYPPLAVLVVIVNALHVVGAAFVAHTVYVTLAYGQPIWCNFPSPVFPIYLMDDIVNVLREITPGCLCHWFPSLIDQRCDETCWWPTVPVPMYKPCASVIDNYGLLWAAAQPFEWAIDALMSPRELGAVAAELAPIDRTQLSCYYYTLATQALLIFILYVALVLAILAFVFQIPTVAQPFYAAHRSLWATIVVATTRTTPAQSTQRHIKID